MSAYTKTILSAILPNNPELLDEAVGQLTEQHFEDSVHRNLFLMLERFLDKTGAIMTLSWMKDVMQASNVNINKLLLYEETFKDLILTETTEADFRWALARLKESMAQRETGEALTSAMEILTKGREEHGVIVRGHTDARNFLIGAVTEIERGLTIQEAPEGDVKTELESILSDYNVRKQEFLSGTATGVQFGIREIDNKTGGLQKGELVLGAGFSSEGKTSTACQLAWHAAVIQGLNVYFCTTETLRPQVMRKLVARHSRMEKFGMISGLDTHELKKGTLDPEDEQKFAQISHDLTSNPLYGSIYVAQMQRYSTIALLEGKLKRASRSIDFDLLIIDYLALFDPRRKRMQKREELSDILTDAKVLAATYNRGKGIPVFSPWQISRAAYEQALRDGYYTMAALAETAEAERSSDIILTLLKADSNAVGRKQDVRIQILKNRDGEQASGITVEVDYANCFMRSKRTVNLSDLLN